MAPRIDGTSIYPSDYNPYLMQGLQQTPIPTSPNEFATTPDFVIPDTQSVVPEMGPGNPYDQPELRSLYQPNQQVFGNPYQNLGNASSARNTKGGDYYSVLYDKESSNNYQAVNEGNYLGAGQLGALALIDAGLVKKGTNNLGLNDSKNWVGNNSKESFLNNPNLQDKTVRSYTERNKKYLGDAYKKASPEERAGLLFSAHLIGAGATLENMNQVDGNGVSGRDRYNIGYGLTGF